MKNKKTKAAKVTKADKSKIEPKEKPKQEKSVLKLTLKRRKSSEVSTIGRLYEDDEFLCFICEDVVREIEGEPVEKWKKYGRTAIPSGKYEVEITYSPKYRRDMPLLKDVEGFKGIRIHSGNTHRDTEGCLLPGKSTDNYQVLYSRAAYRELEKRIKSFDKCYIKIING